MLSEFLVSDALELPTTSSYETTVLRFPSWAYFDITIGLIVVDLLGFIVENLELA